MSDFDEEDFLGEEADKVEAYWCNENHLHVVLSDDGGNDIAGIALDLEEGIDLVQSLMRKLEEMTGMIFVLVEPDGLEFEEDTIGETIGNA